MPGSCKRVEEPSEQRVAIAAAAKPSATAAPLPPVVQVLTLPSSAYQATLVADGEAFELLTSRAAYRLLPGREPQRRELELSFAAAVTRDAYVYWSDGALWSAARQTADSPPKKLLSLRAQPQRIVAGVASNAVAWLTRSADDRYTLETLEGTSAKLLYSSQGSIDAAILLGDALFFVERPSTDGWRIGRVALVGDAPTFTLLKSGRWPAMLAGRPELRFYDGNRRTVVSLSSDLAHESVLAQDVICSPIAAAAQVYCAGMDGVFALPDAGKPHPLVAPSSRPIASLAVGDARLAFVSDVGAQGQDQLAVSVVTLATTARAD